MKRPEAFKELISQSLQRQLDIKITEVEEDLPFIQLRVGLRGRH